MALDAAILPLKDPPRAKTRLGLSGSDRVRLARAFLLDTLKACLPVFSVVVVVGPEGLDLPRSVRHVPDPGGGINAALRAGSRTCEDAALVAAVMGDLPCATPEDLERVSTAPCPVGGMFVSDAEGVGSTCYLNRRDRFDPAFGPRSRARHRQLGATEMTDPGLFRLRRDVDTMVDLEDAVRIGVGPATRRALEALNSRA